MLSINSVWISGNGTLNDIKPNERLLDAKHWHSSDGCLNLLASHLNKPHATSLNELNLDGTISLLSTSDPELNTVWQKANEALINHEIKAIELIDFPEGQERSRTITIEQLPKKGFALWKKPVCRLTSGYASLMTIQFKERQFSEKSAVWLEAKWHSPSIGKIVCCSRC